MRTNGNDLPDDFLAIERTAAEWVLRRRSGLTADEQQELEAWLGRNVGHAAAFAEMEETSRLLDRLRDPALTGAEVVPFEVPPAADSPPATRRRRWLAPVAVGAAAVVTVVAILSLTPRTSPDNYSASLATVRGASRTAEMPDGSVLRLNTDSVVEVAYTASERRVRLKRGEAFFSVAKNPQRPFWVDVGTVSVRAVGTAFNVRFRPESVEVLVKEGKVSVNHAATTATLPASPVVAANDAAPVQLLVAGEQATVSLPTRDSLEPPRIRVAMVAPQRLENTLAWQKGKLEFSDTPLADVVAEFNRYNRHQLVIGDASLLSEAFGGTFAPSGYEAFLEVLEQSFRIVGERRGNETVLRRRLPSTRPN